jgi:hypothetical protein
MTQRYALVHHGRPGLVLCSARCILQLSENESDSRLKAASSIWVHLTSSNFDSESFIVRFVARTSRESNDTNTNFESFFLVFMFKKWYSLGNRINILILKSSEKLRWTCLLVSKIRRNLFNALQSWGPYIAPIFWALQWEEIPELLLISRCEAVGNWRSMSRAFRDSQIFFNHAFIII